MLQGHGSDSHHYDNIQSDFSSNVSRVDYSDVILPILAEHIVELQRYPDVEYAGLVHVLADSLGVSSDHLLVTNGAVAGIYQVAQAFSGSESHLFFPEFAEYECALNMFSHEVTYSSWLDASDFFDIPANETFVMLGNPNNPMGTLMKKSQMCDFLDRRKDVTLVVDESYMEFVSGDESMISEIDRYPHLIVIKSFTKRYSIPGLRLGYLVAQPAMIQRINQWTQPWSVNALAAKVGEVIVAQPEKFPFDWELHRSEKNALYQALSEMSELEVIPSQSHYFLVKMRKFASRQLKEYLIQHHGLLIRDASNFRGLDARYFRVASRSRQENECLIVALKDYFANREIATTHQGKEMG